MPHQRNAKPCTSSRRKASKGSQFVKIDDLRQMSFQIMSGDMVMRLQLTKPRDAHEPTGEQCQPPVWGSACLSQSDVICTFKIERF